MLLSDNSTGHTAMSYYGQPARTGVEYLRSNGERKYRHLRAILQNLGATFDIDERFKYEIEPICNYILANYNDFQINDAHERAKASYKGRGKPPG